jgi:hypothetical protein
MKSDLDLTKERSKLADAVTRWLRRSWVRKPILLVLYTVGLAFCFPWPVKSLPREMDRTISLGLPREMDRTISLGLPREMDRTISLGLPREMDRTISLGLPREMDRTISLGLPLLHRAAFDLVISAFQRVSFSAFAFLISAFPPMPI